MKMPKRLAMLLFITLIFTMIPRITIAATEGNKQSLGPYEREIIRQIEREYPSDYDWEKDLEKAEKIKEMIDRQVEKQIEQSIKRLMKTPTGTATVDLGTDTTFWTADHGDHGKWYWGLAPMILESTHNFNWAGATALLGPGGLAGAGAWAWTGVEFYVNGSGSQAANIIMDSHIMGETDAFAGGSATTMITFIVLDKSTGAKYSTPIYHRSFGGVGFEYVDRHFVNGIGITLIAGHTYVAYLELICEAAVYGMGLGSSDFGDWDLDPGFAYFWCITIEF